MKVYTEKTKEAFLEGKEAALNGDLEKIKRLTYGRMNLEDTDVDGKTILHYATMSGSLEMVKYLVLNCQMDPTYADNDLLLPLDLAKGSVKSFYEEYLGFDIEKTYRNPVRRGFHADPSIVRVGDYYYMVNSSFVYFPCIPISRSQDLVHWEVIGHAVTDKDWAKEHLLNLQGGRGFWAPDISYCNGRFYICATLRNNDDMEFPQTQMVTSSDRPEGPYDTPVIHNIRGIDPSIFTDDDGRRYMLLNRGARMHEISSDGKEILSDAQMICYGYSGHAPEGPHLIKKDGYYYLFLAEGGTGKGHMITVFRSKELKGPYESCPYNPIMTQKNESAAIKCCGHGKPVKTPDGRWFIVYLCSRLAYDEYGFLGRETCLDEMIWTLDGWPIINKGKGPSYIARLPFDRESFDADMSLAYDLNKEENDKEMTDVSSQKEMNEFVLDSLAPKEKRKITKNEMCFVRVMDDDYIEIIDSDSVKIKPCGMDLNNSKCRSICLYSQKDFVTDDAVVLKNTNITKGDECGLVLYYDENSYIKFGIKKKLSEEADTSKDCTGCRNECAENPYDNDGCGEAFEVKISEYVDDKYTRTLRKFVSLDDLHGVSFKVHTDKLKRIFYLNDEYIGELDNVTCLCSEGLIKGKRFTSAMIGAFCVGDDKREDKKAYEFEFLTSESKM